MRRFILTDDFYEGAEYVTLWKIFHDVGDLTPEEIDKIADLKVGEKYDLDGHITIARIEDEP